MFGTIDGQGIRVLEIAVILTFLVVHVLKQWYWILENGIISVLTLRDFYVLLAFIC